jgi:long-chain acyl-CoA synthetase
MDLAARPADDEGITVAMGPWDQRRGVWWIADDHPDALAIAQSPSGARTYGELIGRVNQLVRCFRRLGVSHGETIAVLLPNGLEIVELSLACQEAGWYFLPLNTYLTPAELADALAHAEPAAVVVQERYADRLTEAVRRGAPRLVVVGALPGLLDLDSLASAEISDPPPDRRPGSLFTYTSGTTGKPKGIRRPVPEGDPSQVAHDAALFGRAFGFQPFEGPHLVSTGMYHGGSHSFYMGALNVGHALVIMETFDAEGVLRLIEAHRVRSAYMVPTQFHRMLRLPEEVRRRYDLSSLRSVVHAAAPCPLEIKRQMLEWWGPVIWETYGGMEGAATIAKPRRWLQKPGTVGRAIKGVKLTIADGEGNPLPPGETGLVYIENTTGFEYYRDSEGTSRAYRNGRFTLGDIGYLDEDGYLFLRDRAKDMIISGGVNVYPQEVEAILLTHPAVADVAVIGVPDDDWGEQVKAIVEPATGHVGSPSLENELIDFCKQRLAPFKCPRSVEFRADLPRTEAGKLSKRRIRDEYWEAAGRNV